MQKNRRAICAAEPVRNTGLLRASTVEHRAGIFALYGRGGAALTVRRP
jgi:hypothetical protein